MFEITLNGKTFYHPNSLDYNVTNAVIHEALNDAGYMDITIPYSNPMYNEIQERKGKIVVYKDNVPLWYGEVRDISVDFVKNKTLYVVGEASYLNDTVQPQKRLKGTKYQVLQQIINQHNSMCGDDKKFQAGTIGNNSNREINIVTDWEYSLDAIREHLCDDEEYIRIMHVDNVRYIDIMPLDSYGKRSTQTIMFGDNLLDYTEDSSGEKIATVCIPLGSTLENEKIEGYENYLTCESANNGKNYVELPGAVDRLGRITKVVHFNVLSDAKALVTAATNYLKTAQYAMLTLKLSAVDLSILHSDIEDYVVGDYVRAISEPMGMDAWFPIRERETDLLNLANNIICIGAEGSKSITTQNAETVDEIEQKIPKKSSILKAALKNASNLINSNGTNGNVSIRTDENGKPYEILIMNADSLEQSTQVWRWNLNGFGHGTKKAGTSEVTWSADVAITMDGAIVADAITSGTMSATRIKGGTLEVGGSGTAKNGSITVKNAKDSQIAKIDNQGINIGAGSITLGKNFSVDNDGNMVAKSGEISGFTIGNYAPSNSAEFKYEKDANHYIRLAGGAWGGSLTLGGNSGHSSMTDNGFFTGGKVEAGKDIETSANVKAHGYYASSDGVWVGGRSTKAFSFTGYVDGEQKAIGLRFEDGILVGITDNIKP